MNKINNEEEHFVTLKVHKSAIGSIDSGIVRINSTYLRSFEEEDIDMVELRAGKKKKVVRLASDRLVPRGKVVLREGDMEDLEVEEGDDLEIHPYHKLSDELKEKWAKFKDRLKRKNNEEDEKDDH
ncbi:MAG: hypothetical protein ACMUHB_04800 [Thermoplasmatota archaeon]